MSSKYKTGSVVKKLQSNKR